MYNVHLTHSLLCFEFVELTLNKQGQREPGRFLDFLHYQSFLVVLKYQILNQIAASTTAIKAMPSA